MIRRLPYLWFLVLALTFAFGGVFLGFLQGPWHVEPASFEVDGGQ